MLQIPQQICVSIESCNLERESLLIGEKIMLLKILAMEKLKFGKKGMILELEWGGCERQGFHNLKRALLTIEGLYSLSRAMAF